MQKLHILAYSIVWKGVASIQVVLSWGIEEKRLQFCLPHLPVNTGTEELRSYKQNQEKRLLHIFRKKQLLQMRFIKTSFCYCLQCFSHLLVLANNATPPMVIKHLLCQFPFLEKRTDYLKGMVLNLISYPSAIRLCLGKIQTKDVIN